jgi:cytochrome c oxidase cbb3-type subunit 3
MADQPYIDEKTGMATTGHEWDGIRELNTPLPRWWVWVLIVTVIWAIGYWIAMPAWPYFTGYTKGVLGYSSRAALQEELDRVEKARAPMNQRLADASLEQIRTDPALLEFALAGGRSAFNVNCTPCHGSGAQGAPGYPNLNDDIWLWGGTLDQIAYTITHGVRNDTDDDARANDMPAFGKDEILEPKQINDVVEYVLSLNDRADDAAAAKRGKAIFAENCVACHGENAGGNPELGAPPLNTDIWLYGGDKKTLIQTVTNARRGVMPAWGQHLDKATIKKLAIYVHSLGGGK